MIFSQEELPKGWMVKEEWYSYEKKAAHTTVLINERVFGLYTVQIYDAILPRVVRCEIKVYSPKEAFELGDYILSTYPESLEGLFEDKRINEAKDR